MEDYTPRTHIATILRSKGREQRDIDILTKGKPRATARTLWNIINNEYNGEISGFIVDRGIVKGSGLQGIVEGIYDEMFFQLRDDYLHTLFKEIFSYKHYPKALLEKLDYTPLEFWNMYHTNKYGSMYAWARANDIDPDSEEDLIFSLTDVLYRVKRSP